MAVLVSLLSTVAPAASASAATQDAMSEVRATVDQVLGIIKSPDYKTGAAMRRQKLRELIGDHFDFADMARSALGPHWKEINDEQRRQFTDLFTRFMETSYMGKIESYSGQRIDYLKEIADNSDYAQVNTEIEQEGKDPISVNYRLKHQGDQWKVYDVTIDGISLVGNYRNQFNRIFNNKGFDALIEAMQRKQEQLSSER